MPLAKSAKISFYGENSKQLVASVAGSAEVVTTLVTDLYDSAVKKLGAAQVEFGEVTTETGVVLVTVGCNGQEGRDRPDMLMEPEDAVVFATELAPPISRLSDCIDLPG